MDCHDFLHLAAGYRDGSLSRYARAVFEWHRATCPRCAATTARKNSLGPKRLSRPRQSARSA